MLRYAATEHSSQCLTPINPGGLIVIARRALFSALGATGLFSFSRAAAAQTGQSARSFNGLVSGLADLAGCRAPRHARSAPRTSPAKRAAAAGGQRHRRQGGARPRQGLEGFAVGADRGRPDVHAGRDRRPRRDPAHLDDADRHTGASRSCASTGTAKRHRRSKCPVGDFFACGWGKYAPGQLAARSCVNPGSAFNCYWAMPFRKRCRITMTNIADEAMTLYYQINYTLTDVPDDAAYFHAQFRRVEPAALQAGLHARSTASRAGPVRRHVHGLGRQQHRLVGRRRDQVLHGRRQRVPDDLRHRHRGLFLRLATTSRTRTTQAVSGVHDALRRAAAGDPARRRSISRSSASACTAGTSWIRSASSRTARDDPGAGLAQRRRRYLPLQDDIASVAYWYQSRAARAVPGAAGEGRAGDRWGAWAGRDRRRA